MPVMFGSVTLSAAAIAIAASTALPPRLSTSRPICDASGWLDATIPFVERTTERPARNPENQSVAGLGTFAPFGGAAASVGAWRQASPATIATRTATTNGINVASVFFIVCPRRLFYRRCAHTVET